jgi:hypothetical protein
LKLTPRFFARVIYCVITHTLPYYIISYLLAVSEIHFIEIWSEKCIFLTLRLFSSISPLIFGVLLRYFIFLFSSLGRSYLFYIMCVYFEYLSRSIIAKIDVCEKRKKFSALVLRVRYVYDPLPPPTGESPSSNLSYFIHFYP